MFYLEDGNSMLLVRALVTSKIEFSFYFLTQHIIFIFIIAGYTAFLRRVKGLQSPLKFNELIIVIAGDGLGRSHSPDALSH